MTEEKESMKGEGRITHEIKIISEMKIKLKESQMQINTMDNALRLKA